MKRKLSLLVSVALPWMTLAASMEDVSYAILKGEVILGICSKEAQGELVIPDELDGYPVTKIADGAFRQCDGLTAIRLPKGLQQIGNGVFDGTLNLPVDEAGFQYESAEKRILLRAPRSLKGHYTVCESVQFIGENAFENCTDLTSITLPKQLLGIGAFAFSECERLEKIEIPESVQSIGLYAFFACRALRFARLPQDLRDLGDKLFANCGALEEVILPTQLQKVPLCCFERCDSLKKITLPETLQVIETYAFQECSALTTLALPNTLKGIGSGAFSRCEALSLSTFPTQLEWMDDDVFGQFKRFVDVDGAEYESPAKVILFQVPQKKEGKAVEIPASVRFICGAFEEWENLETITIPEGVIEIHDGAFANCKQLRSVTLPESLKRIGDESFKGCSSLTSITIPQGVVRIGEEAFTGCTSLSSIVIPQGVTVIESEAFAKCSQLERVVILGGNVELQWRAFDETSLKEIYFGNRPPQMAWEEIVDSFPQPTDASAVKGYYSAAYERYWKQCLNADQTWRGLEMHCLPQINANQGATKDEERF